MLKPRVIFVVGHSNWGKSATLRALTNGSYRQRRTDIQGVEFFIRRMSNDDRPKSFIERMKAINPVVWPNVIAALCPNFDDKAVQTQSTLEGLRKKGYELYFWIIQHQYGTSEMITEEEVISLRRFGRVEVFTGMVEADVRANNFKRFIKSAVLA